PGARPVGGALADGPDRLGRPAPVPPVGARGVRSAHGRRQSAHRRPPGAGRLPAPRSRGPGPAGPGAGVEPTMSDTEHGTENGTGAANEVNGTESKGTGAGGTESYELVVNGVRRRVEGALPTESLLRVLRDRLGLPC